MEKQTVSAMSCPVKGSKPLYTESAFSLSPRNRTTENSVSTKPGSILMTLIGVAISSCRRDLVIAVTACLVAQLRSLIERIPKSLTI